MLYLGLPYSHPKSVIREVRYLAALQACAHFFEQGIPVHCPIVHWHQCTIMHKLPKHAEPWQVQNRRLLARANGFAMLLLDDWESSVGLREEWFQAMQLDLQIDRYILHAGETYWVGQGLPTWPSKA